MILTIALVLAITVAALEIRRRLRKRADNNGGGRYRSNRGSLNLDRQSRGGRSTGGRNAGGLAGPIFLGLVAAVLGFWMLAAYLFPEAEMPVASLEPVADAAPPEQFHVLAGRLTPEQAPQSGPGGSIALAARDTADNSAASAPLPTLAPEPGLASAAQAMIPAHSRLDQVGLLPGKNEGKTTTAPPQPVRTAQAQPAPPRTPAVAPSAPAPPARATNNNFTSPAPAAGSGSGTFDQVDPSSVVAATSATPGSISSPAPGATRPAAAAPISGRAFTVHLASFTEPDNAEKYKNHLTNAGEAAFISENTADGRHWFRVMCGRFASRNEANAYGLELRRRGLTTDNGRFLVKDVD